MRDTVNSLALHGKSVGLVPTMGALHEGHLSLVRRARSENAVTVVSVFVNPLQFGPSEDFQKYPRDIEGDSKKLAEEEVDILFMPDTVAMYPENFLSHVEVEKLSERLCGSFRPGHFRGVATIVTKLFHIVKPVRAYFGQKDFQQTVIIKRLVKDLDMDIDVVVCPTIRERDGLAMSSRNTYLDPVQRAASAIVYRCLREASELVRSGIINVGHVKAVMKETILSEPAVETVDYAGVYDPESLDEPYEIKESVVLAVAVKIGGTRLIDNMLVDVEKER
jgi:pantoate--beta-alanine ligase